MRTPPIVRTPGSRVLKFVSESIHSPVYNPTTDPIAAGPLTPMREDFSQTDIEELTRFLADPKRPESTLCFQELQGFLFAVACSPELIPPAEWLPAIGDDEDLRFQDDSEMQKIMGLIITLYNGINNSVLERSKSMPLGCEFQPDIEDNFDPELAVSQWSQGFMAGHDWLTEVWDEYFPEEIDGEFGSTAVVLSFFSSRRLAELYHAEATTTPRQRRPRVPFNEYAETVRRLFPDGLSAYAHIGRTISEVLTRSGESEA